MLLGLGIVLAGGTVGDFSRAAGDGGASIPVRGDCNDADGSVNGRQLEVPANRKDDDCDGLADEDAANNPSLDFGDFDGDGRSPAVGDCDDTAPGVGLGLPEVLGNRRDDDCDGIADEDAMGLPPDDFRDDDQDGMTLDPDNLPRSGFEPLASASG